MKNKYITEILNEYDHLQRIAKDEQLVRQNEIYKRFPRIKQIDEEIAQAGFDIAASVLKGNIVEGFINQQKNLITDLKIEKAEILSLNNYPIDYLEVKYKCSKCKDTGYVGSERCSCFKQKLIDMNYEQSNLKNLLKRENFETFDINLYSTSKFPGEAISPRRNMEEIYARCVDFTENFDNLYENLFFYGSSGLGKSFLSNCVARELLNKGKVVIYQTASNLIDTIRTIRFSDDSADEQLKDLYYCDLLIIDDFGTEPNTGYSQSEMFNIINERLLNNKKMIISTNLFLEDLENYSERIRSRILGNFTLCKFYGEDIRILKKTLGTKGNRA